MADKITIKFLIGEKYIDWDIMPFKVSLDNGKTFVDKLSELKRILNGR